MFTGELKSLYSLLYCSKPNTFLFLSSLCLRLKFINIIKVLSDFYLIDDDVTKSELHPLDRVLLSICFQKKKSVFTTPFKITKMG